ncbi:hypothetical protein QTP86_023941, partial [Hemibagrus guttatus]
MEAPQTQVGHSAHNQTKGKLSTKAAEISAFLKNTKGKSDRAGLASRRAVLTLLPKKGDHSPQELAPCLLTLHRLQGARECISNKTEE